MVRLLLVHLAIAWPVNHASSLRRACCLTVSLVTLRRLMEVGHLALQVLADEQGSKWPARIAVSQSRYLLEHMGEILQSCSLQAHSLSFVQVSAVLLGWKCSTAASITSPESAA